MEVYVQLMPALEVMFVHVAAQCGKQGVCGVYGSMCTASGALSKFMSVTEGEL